MQKIYRTEDPGLKTSQSPQKKTSQRSRRASRKPDWQLKIVRERVSKLLELAEKYSKENPTYSRKCIKLAVKIGMRYNFRLDKKTKRKICKKCFSFLIPGGNCTVRTSPKQQAVITTCKNCGSIKRFPYRKEKVKSRKSI